jgi:transposase-like protein
VGRRGIKEYRAPEALILIAADRDHKPLVCPSCASAAVDRNPPRSAKGDDHSAGRVTLHCAGCGRSAVYIDRGAAPSPVPEAPKAR